MSIKAAMENPEPIEPTMTSTPDGLYCLVHGEMECRRPFCYRCGNHQMDDFGRCADPRCRATNGADPLDLVVVLIAETKQRWAQTFAGPCPVEVIEYAIGSTMYERFCRSFAYQHEGESK